MKKRYIYTLVSACMLGLASAGSTSSIAPQSVSPLSSSASSDTLLHGFVNVQAHADFRDYTTYTNEYLLLAPKFNLELYGFNEMDDNDTKLRYAESMLYWNLGKVNPALEQWALTAQFNGGDAKFFNIDDVGLFGVRYKFYKGMSIEALMRTDGNPQFTYVWNYEFKLIEGASSKFGTLQVCGFADLWWNSKPVFLSEPQLWFWLNDYVAVGGEYEISRNFVSRHWKAHPTAAIKVQYSF